MANLQSLAAVQAVCTNKMFVFLGCEVYVLDKWTQSLFCSLDDYGKDNECKVSVKGRKLMNGKLT